MRILVAGDSLGLPRPHRINNYSPDEKELAVAYEETYSSILGRELLKYYNFDSHVEVINRSKRFYTIKDVNTEFADHLFFFEPDVIVMQVGIVDCWFREHLNGGQMVNKVDYEQHLLNILNLLKYRPNCRLIIIGISPTSSKMEKKYKGINKEIQTYNQVLKSYVNNKNVFYVDLEKYIKPDSTAEFLLPDDHHLNKNGNKLIASLLIELLKAFVYSDKGVYDYNAGKLEESLLHLQKAFGYYPGYIDNLCNCLLLCHQLGKLNELNEIISYRKK